MRKKYCNLRKSTTCTAKIWEKSTVILERVLLVLLKYEKKVLKCSKEY